MYVSRYRRFAALLNFPCLYSYLAFRCIIDPLPTTPNLLTHRLTPQVPSKLEWVSKLAISKWGLDLLRNAKKIKQRIACSETLKTTGAARSPIRENFFSQSTDDYLISNMGRTNRRNTAKTSVDRNTKITLTRTVAGCN